MWFLGFFIVLLLLLIAFLILVACAFSDLVQERDKEIERLKNPPANNERNDENKRGIEL